MPLQPKRHMKTQKKTVGQIVATWCTTSDTSASERLSHQMILRQTQHQLEAKKFAKSAPSQVPKMIISTMVSTWNDRRTGSVFKHQWLVAFFVCIIIEFLEMTFGVALDESRWLFKMLLSGCPAAQRAACQECAKGHVCSRTVKRRV